LGLQLPQVSGIAVNKRDLSVIGHVVSGRWGSPRHVSI
jgi:hypothetical protein